jgi:predicted aspartyl protease
MKYNDSLLQPPGPVVSIRVSPTKRSEPFRDRLAEIDTGADISVIPDSLAADLQLKAKGPVIMLSYDKDPVERSTYLVDLEILGYKLRSVRVARAPRDTILLGRDVLKHFVITLDGKAQTFEMADP